MSTRLYTQVINSCTDCPNRSDLSDSYTMVNYAYKFFIYCPILNRKLEEDANGVVGIPNDCPLEVV